MKHSIKKVGDTFWKNGTTTKITPMSVTDNIESNTPKDVCRS